MTFIFNVLHKDMSILAADKKGVAEWPNKWGLPTQEKAETLDYKKIWTIPTAKLAIGVAGYSPHNLYVNEIEESRNVSVALSVIRHHMENFLLVDDLASLIESASPFVNECIASFYDENTQTYFTNEFQFNEFRNKTHLHRASEGIKIFVAGSGRDHFDVSEGKKEIQALLQSSDQDFLQEALISWMEGVFKMVSAKDEGCGPEAMFVVSSRTNHAFHPVDRS